jgi:hypothetical protein
MTDLDLERLGDVWRQQPDPAEMERLQRTAAAVSRRARWGQAVDVISAVAVAAVVILLVISNPQRNTLLMGSAAIVVLLVSNIRQRKLRQVELMGLTGGTEEMLDQSIARVEATLKRSRFALIAIGPSLLVGGFVAASAGASRGGSVFPALNDLPLLRVLWAGAAITGIAGFAIFTAFAIRRGRQELERLITMREAYRRERESTT